MSPYFKEEIVKSPDLDTTFLACHKYVVGFQLFFTFLCDQEPNLAKPSCGYGPGPPARVNQSACVVGTFTFSSEAYWWSH